MNKNNFKMRCVETTDGTGTYIKGKIYECKNGVVTPESGMRHSKEFNSFKEFQRWSSSGKWELVEDDVETSKTITINISNNKSTLTDSNGVELCICRYYTTDKHDEKLVINELTKRYVDELDRIEKEKNKLKVGDNVRVVDDGLRYPSYKGFIIENAEELQKQMSITDFVRLVLNFEKGKVIPKKLDTYKVNLIIELIASKETNLAIVSNNTDTFIIDIRGLEKVNN